MIGRILICTIWTWGTNLKQELLDCGVKSVVICDSRGTELLEFLRGYRPNIFIADATYLENCLEPIIRIIRKEIPDMEITVMSLCDDRAQKMALEKAGADFQFLLPVDWRMVCNRILHIEPGLERYAEPKELFGKLRAQAVQWVMSLKIPANYKGFGPLCDAVAEGARDLSMVKQTMDMYAWLAERYETTPASIERNIRTLIEAGWKKGGHEAFYQRFGFYITPEEKNKVKPPSNSLLIETLAEYLRFAQAEAK